MNKKTILLAIMSGLVIFSGNAIDFSDPANKKAIALCKEATLENNVVTVTQKTLPVSGPKFRGVQFPINFTELGATGKTITVSGEIKFTDVSRPAQNWNGVKAMLIFRAAGKQEYPPCYKGITYGTRDWTPFSASIAIPAETNRGTLALGLQDSTGSVSFRNIKLTVK